MRRVGAWRRLLRGLGPGFYGMLDCASLIQPARRGLESKGAGSRITESSSAQALSGMTEVGPG